MSLLAQTDSEILRIAASSGFQQWLIYAFIAFVLWDKISNRMARDKAQPRVVTGSIESRESQTPALKSEMEDELEDIDRQITDLRTHLDKQFEKMLAAGEHRAEKITKRIDDEIRAIRSDLEQRCTAIHDKVNGVALHMAAGDEAIQNLKTADYRHDQMIQGLQTKILNTTKPK
jgi:hypothetical protein